MSKILITGGDGHLGRAIARWLLKNSDKDLILWTRASNSSERNAKTNTLKCLLDSQRCEIEFGDLNQRQPFAHIDPGQIEAIVHTAAVTDFNVGHVHARRTNVDGTRRLLEFATQCTGLQRCALLSTLYIAGLRSGTLTENLLGNDARFANYYEWSKWESECLLSDQFNSLPWQVFRVATVIANDSNGQVVQQNVLHNTMRLMYYGLLSIVPGNSDTRIYLTTTDYAATACGRLLLGGPRHQVFHVSDDGTRAMKLGPLLDLVYDCFCEDAQFKRQRILKPLLCDQRAFDTLVTGATLQSDVIRQALNSVAPFAPQLFSDKDVSTLNLSAALPDLLAPNVADIMPWVSRNLVATRWGNHPEGILDQ